MRIIILLSVLSAFLVAAAAAPNVTNNFLTEPQTQQFIDQMVKENRFDRKTLEALIGAVKPRPKIIHSMKHPSEANPWLVYQHLFITKDRIAQGKVFYTKNKTALMRAEKKYGVPASIITATIGIETNYFKSTGSYPVIDALVNLAFSPNYQARHQFFQTELKEFLLLCREQGFKPGELLGSYAGAIGGSQFMPDSYRRYGVDFSHTGKVDLFQDIVDVIGSTANFYQKHGWHADEAIMVSAKATKKAANNLVANNRHKSYTLVELKKAGLTPSKPITTSKHELYVIKVKDAKGQPAYYIGLHNFAVIMHYNTSYLYAMAVTKLSEQINEDVM